ncbi:MAG: hypothetical protein A2100_01325 [Sideroxydans sp. GWF2_59_14]|nr:MAG: hypothetical protein A2100_01325 [Sideroxydans sp. GWF2_59_14]HAF44124.1 hypothetical protein [Gallionellaceae bacterium]
MSFSKDDLPFLKLSLGALALSLALAAGMITYSDSYLAKSQQARADAQKHLLDARAQLVAAQGDQENMSSYSQEYLSLQNQKVIGAEQRLDWMEGMEKLRQQGFVLDFKYTISPQQGYVPNPPVEAGNFQLSRSNMSMQIDLLHEEQLLQFITALHSQLQGWFMLDGCTLTRATAGVESTPLKAECSGGWFTMKNRNMP